MLESAISLTCVHIWVKSSYIEEFIKETLENHEKSRQEPGNLRFDVLRDVNNPNKFVLYEVYESKEAAVSHKTTPHYLKWRDSVANMMEKPREGVAYEVLSPLDLNLW
jgi:(4S)-4-hydroxy-5-phosphonooxypentane-2,3-dione isomerase